LPLLERFQNAPYSYIVTLYRLAQRTEFETILSGIRQLSCFWSTIVAGDSDKLCMADLLERSRARRERGGRSAPRCAIARRRVLAAAEASISTARRGWFMNLL
jgi:hypothetical protein